MSDDKLVIRKTDQKEVSIGDYHTYHKLRFTDRHQVTEKSNSVIRMALGEWRTPVPSEDTIQPGDYVTAQAGVVRKNGRVISFHKEICLRDGPGFFGALTRYPTYVSTPNPFHKDGKVKFPCYHYLPQFMPPVYLNKEWGEYVSPFFIRSLYLSSDQLNIAIECFYCRHQLSVSFPELESRILSVETKKKYLLFLLGLLA